LLCGKRDRKKAGDKEVKLNGKMRKRPEKDKPSGHPSGALFAANGARTRDALHIADLPRARRLNVKSAGSLEHVPEKWTRFSDKDMLQVFELARILFDQVIPPDRKAR
jgi:hypothetical protein